MRNLIRIVMLLALLNSRAAMAQAIDLARSSGLSTSVSGASPMAQDTRLIVRAPVGHRQRKARDVPSASSADIERIGEEDVALDRKLIICRGC